MAHVFRAKSFIGDSSAKSHGQTDGRGVDSLSKQVEDYLSLHDVGGATNIDEVNSVTSCKLNGDRVFVLVVLEDNTGSG
jgi:hypothetical protein